MNPCIYYHPEGYTTSGPKLMGRHSAGEGFLRGFLRYGNSQRFWLQVEQLEHVESFVTEARDLNRREPINAFRAHELGRLAESGLLFSPGPGISEHAWHRAAYGHEAWSICGITHTLSSAGAMDAITSIVTSPTQPWDALICTSTAGRSVVEQLIQSQVEYLQNRLGIQRLVMPKLPVIPLGIHTHDFIFSAEDRAKSRAFLGVEENTHVVLFAGRLSFHAKAHPLAMYQALEQASLSLPPGEKILLIEFGLFPNEHIERAFFAAAQQAAPHVLFQHLDGRSHENRLHAWAGADIFVSLSDNIQETFGLTPVEAMAAGLPVVVSDWNGYKDTVRHGVDGFRIPTLMPQSGLGADLALRHANKVDTYDMYCGHACSLVAVDVEACVEAFTHLVKSRGLRLQMGQAGRLRARQLYDWSIIIQKYESLWSELVEIRKEKGVDLKPPHYTWPARTDPFQVFSKYPSYVLASTTRLVLVDADPETAFRRFLGYRQLAMVDFARAILPTDEEVFNVLTRAVTVSDAQVLVQHIVPERRPIVLRSLVWLVKLGILTMSP
jgi:alpha-maltose-1-phosphate synthase